MTSRLQHVVTAVLIATTAACATRVKPTTYFVPVNQWEALSDCILVTSIERGYTMQMSTLGIHVTRPPKGTPTRFTDINHPQAANGQNPLRTMKSGVHGKPIVTEEVFYERRFIPEGIVLKAESRAIDRTMNAVVGASMGPTSKVAPSAYIQGAQRELQKACMRNVQLYMGALTGQVASIDAH